MALLVVLGILADARTHGASAQEKRDAATDGSRLRKAAHPHGDLDLECGLCHGTKGWRPAKVSGHFDHGRYGFRLEGAHAKAECVFCHDNLLFTGATNRCAACHQDVHQGEFGNDCARCHQTRSFIDRPAEIGMHRTTRFPLTGSHANLECERCHRDESRGGSRFVNTPTACEACHMKDYRAAKRPDHQAGGFRTACADCHNTVDWAGGSYRGDHSFFPLQGGHANLECARCHGSRSFSEADRACWSCHEADFASTSSPNHAASGFPMDCTACHDIRSWAGARFDHGATAFPLTGAHRSVDCAACHDNGVDLGLSQDCVACHRQDYDATVDPSHAASGFSSDCTSCHGTTTWIGARFEHTLFPLRGAHGSLDCSACHGDGIYAGRDPACFACHQQDYATTTDPNHGAAGFPTDCSQCHGTTSFDGAQFAHTAFPLTGGHTGLDCAQCHGSGVSAGLSRDCVFCHQADYEATTDPRHGSAGFGTDCASCHRTTTWNDATFDHDANFFPINSSTHRGKWNECSDCHVNPSNYAVFSCFNCHAHDRTRMDTKHAGVSGYRYDSYACYDCHPTGNH